MIEPCQHENDNYRIEDYAVINKLLTFYIN